MQNFHYYAPTEVFFGRGAEEKLADVCIAHGVRRAFILYGGGSVQRSGLLGRAERLLADTGIDFRTRGGVKANPTLAFAREAVREAVDYRADLILAVGGGSVIDTAKAVAIGMAHPDADVWDFWTRRRDVTASAPVGVILTIPAAGSEMSDSAVLTNEETGEKVGLSTNFNRPLFALMNPELVSTLSPWQMANGVVDIIMHTLERYTVRDTENRLTDAIAEALLRTVIECGPRAVRDAGDYDAVSEIMWAGSLSHNDLTGLGRVRDMPVHKLGHELSARFDASHGATLSALWCSWARLSYDAALPRFVRLAEFVWGIQDGTDEEKALGGIARFEAFFASIDMPVSIEQLVGKQSDGTLQDMARAVTKKDTFRFGRAVKEVDQARALQIYRAAG
ncbi:iron-containing alcohol dehydrogenase [Selenomonas sp. TAMA-11512]|uniref:iron-containing alcohol dehydrogenase n=1 Tax=Selenomonas sp. TAMA-11512 TaxID=3095337 RepID=UPI00308E4F99|nr:iron-containing alcohol dehydrogenase [Selenomonas sp. TAMA-11512]